MGKASRSKNKYKFKEHRNRPSDTSTSADDEEATANTHEPHIPGYYYDKEKKRFFKILPNSQSSVSSAVTNETIKKNKYENQRLSDRSKETQEASTTSTSTIALSESKKSTGKLLTMEPLLKVLSSMQCGQYTCKSLQRYVMGQRCLRLKPQPGWENGKIATPVSNNPSLGDILRLEVNATYDKAITVWSQKDIVLHWMELVSFDTAKKKPSVTNTNDGRHIDLSVDVPDGSVGMSMNKVTSLCWCPMSQCPEKTCVLYSTVCPISYSGSRVSITNLQPSSVTDAHMFNFDLGIHRVWSSAWNNQSSRFSIGCERQIQVIDIHSRCKWTYFTQNSDALALQCSEKNSQLLYTGTRNGYVLVIDMRTSQRQKPAAKLRQRNAVVCLRSRRDDNYLMASDYSGLIKTWDLRHQKVVQRFTGLSNTHYQLPFFLDSTEKFVYATGCDGYSKIWDAKDESLLKTLAPPLPVHSVEGFPISHLSESWGRRNGEFGLVTAMGSNFYMYT